MSPPDMRRTRRTVLRTLGGSAVALTAVGLASADHMHPEVTTLGASDVTHSSAFLHGEVEEFGEGATYADAWFQYRVAGTSTWLGTDSQTLDSPSQYSQWVSGLQSDTTYEFRAVAQDSDGDFGYGDIFTFRTLDDDQQIP